MPTRLEQIRDLAIQEIAAVELKGQMQAHAAAKPKVPQLRQQGQMARVAELVTTLVSYPADMREAAGNADLTVNLAGSLEVLAKELSSLTSDWQTGATIGGTDVAGDMEK